jgi:hypothetical protein
MGLNNVPRGRGPHLIWYELGPQLAPSILDDPKVILSLSNVDLDNVIN